MVPDVDVARASAVTLAAAACITDIRSRRIPNELTLGAAAIALVWHALASQGPGALGSASGWLAGALLFMPFFVLGGMGGGDVKLLAALGAWLGPIAVFWIAIHTSLAGGILAVVVALTRGYLRTALSNVGALAAHWYVNGPRPLPGLTLGSSEAPRLPYAIPILIGTAVTLWLRQGE
jgi:prepilin peptidase CpaA